MCKVVFYVTCLHCLGFSKERIPQLAPSLAFGLLKDVNVQLEIQFLLSIELCFLVLLGSMETSGKSGSGIARLVFIGSTSTQYGPI